MYEEALVAESQLRGSSDKVYHLDSLLFAFGARGIILVSYCSPFTEKKNKRMEDQTNRGHL